MLLFFLFLFFFFLCEHKIAFLVGAMLGLKESTEKEEEERGKGEGAREGVIIG